VSELCLNFAINRIQCFKVLFKRLPRCNGEGTGRQKQGGVRQQHVKRNTTKYENGRCLEQEAETAPIKQQGESHIRTKIVEHGGWGAGGEGIPV
jgi:hypothetical protein